MTNEQKSISPKKYLLIAVLVLFILLLRIKTFSRPSGPDSVSFYNDQGEIVLIGMVAEPPQVQGRWQRIKVATTEGTISAFQRNPQCFQWLQGKVLVKTRLYPEYHYGDILQLTGELKTPPVFEDFSYKEYLEIQGIYSLMDFPKIQQSTISNLPAEVLPVRQAGLAKAGQQSAIWESCKTWLLIQVYSLREKFEQIINQILPEPHASLLAGILFGIERDFAPEFYSQMQKAGVLHIIVASGYNIMIVSSFFLGLAPIIGRKKNLVLAVFGVLIYAVIAGLQPPIIRAAIMGGGAMLAEAFGRRKDALLWLCFAAFLMLFANPLLYKSVSFQLSFGAALGLLLFGSRLQKLLWRVPRVFRESLATTLAVQIFSLPIVFFNFHEVGIFSLPVNTLILETIPIIMGLGAVATFGGLFNLHLGQLLAFPVWVILSYFVKVVQVFT